MVAQFVVADVMVALDRGVLDGAVHPLDLAVRPRTARLGQAMLDLGLIAGPVERMPAVDAWLVALGPVGVGCSVGLLIHLPIVSELDAVVGQHREDRIGHGYDQRSRRKSAAIR
jgi:hypothetical protein